MEVFLKKLCEKESDAVYDMFMEIPAQEDGFENPAHGMDRHQFNDFCRQKFRHAQGLDLAEGYVPDTYYILYVDELPIGFVKLRHYLNDHLRQSGGHIGYGIRPSARGQKYGNRILQEVLKFAQKLGLDKVLLTVDNDNIRSRKVIEHNGGQLEKTENNKLYYWIKL